MGVATALGMMHLDALSAFYPPHDRWLAPLLTELSSSLSPERTLAERLAREESVIEIGCGRGRTLRWLVDNYRPTVWGLDRDPIKIGDARGLLADSTVKPGLICADVRSYEPSQRFGLVLLYVSLHDLDRPLDVLERARAWLRRDGFIIVIDIVEYLQEPIERLFAEARFAADRVAVHRDEHVVVAWDRA